mmetsp:Transcript_38793/g.75718  ORF Transcript_38793/g.75718 Transcript_38793/m.75718 type:complete len:127 (-) Transcript_38793:876-1256(-)
MKTNRGAEVSFRIILIFNERAVPQQHSYGPARDRAPPAFPRPTMGRSTIISSCRGQGHGQRVLRVRGGGAPNAPQGETRVRPHHYAMAPLLEPPHWWSKSMVTPPASSARSRRPQSNDARRLPPAA